MRALLPSVCLLLVLGCAEDKRPKMQPSTSESAIPTRDKPIADLERNMRFESQVGQRLQKGDNVGRVLDDVLAHAKETSER